MAQPNFNNPLSAKNDWKHHSTFPLQWSQSKGWEKTVFFHLSVFCNFYKFCFLVGGTNPEESCKVQFEGNLEPISRVYKELQPFSFLTLHPTTLLQILIGNYENCKMLEEKVQEIILSRKQIFGSPKLNQNYGLVEMVGC